MRNGPKKYKLLSTRQFIGSSGWPFTDNPEKIQKQKRPVTGELRPVPFIVQALGALQAGRDY
jgi:hypothetical protein